MPAFTHLRRLSQDIRAKLPLRKDSHNTASIVLVQDESPSYERVIEEPPSYEDIFQRTASFGGHRVHFEETIALRPNSQIRGDSAASTSFGVPVERGRANASPAVSDFEVRATDMTPAGLVVRDRRVERDQSAIANLPTEILLHIASFLNPQYSASLALACYSLSIRLGANVWPLLDSQEHSSARSAFLAHMDEKLPNHLLCYGCGTFHRRLSSGDERFAGSDSLARVTGCRKRLSTPAVRLTNDKNLAFAFFQLLMRAHRYGPLHGVSPKSLACSWTPLSNGWDGESNWKHRVKFIICEDRLLFKTVSTAYVRYGLTASERRLLLENRNDYAANYSTCPHWAYDRQQGINDMCRCALSHLPAGPGKNIPSQCANCRMLRRCMTCPTEYLVELKLQENKRHNIDFIYTLIVSRWTDLGSDITPLSAEWSACTSRPGSELAVTTKLRGGPSIRVCFEAACNIRAPDVSAVPLKPPMRWRSNSNESSAERAVKLSIKRQRGNYANYPI